MLNKTYVQLLLLLHVCDSWGQDTVEPKPYSRLHTQYRATMAGSSLA